MLLLAPVLNLRFKHSLSEGIELFGIEYLTGFKRSTFLTNDKDYIQRRLIINPRWKEMIGKFEYDNLDCAFYISDPQLGLETPDLGVDFLAEWQLRLYSFLNALWFIKDNSVQVDRAFIFSLLKHQKVLCSMQSPHLGFFYNCKGLIQIIDYTEEEIGEASSFYNNYLNPLVYNEIIKQSKKEREKLLGESLVVNIEGISKFARFEYYLGLARGNRDLSTKLSLYATCLETLFSDETQEVTHKLAERVACFLGDDGNERKIIHQTVKDAYNYRSRLTHGDAIKVKKMESMLKLSEGLDRILRNAFKKIVLDRELRNLFELDTDSGKKRREEYFTNLLFNI